MLTAAVIASIALLVLVVYEHRSTLARATASAPPLARAVETQGIVPVAILLPARDESAVIGDALRSVREQTVAPEQIIVIDDGSADDTGAVAREAFAGVPHAMVIRVDDVPAGWTGKTNALARGLEHATAEWILTIDADVQLAPDALARAYATARADDLDALSLSPTQDAPAGAVRALQEAAYALLDRLYPFRETSRPGSRETAASGAFTLVRRAALVATGGFTAVRGDLIEDLALVRALVARGARVSFRPAQGVVRVRMYRTLGDAFAGWTRLLAPLVASSPRAHGMTAEIARAVGTSAALPLAGGALAWFVSYGAVAQSGALACATGATVLALGGAPAAARWVTGRALLGAALCASAFAHRSARGVQWKGRAYATPAS